MQGIRRDEDRALPDWGQGPAAVPRFKTDFPADNTQTRGFLQGTVVDPPGTRVVPHWHTPVETRFLLPGSGAAHSGRDMFRLAPGAAIGVPSRVVHWFEMETDASLIVVWTLARATRWPISISRRRRTLSRPEPDTCIDSDHFAVHHRIADHRQAEVGEILRCARSLRKDCIAGDGLDHFGRHFGGHRCLKQTRGDGQHPNAPGREFAGGLDRQGSDGAL
jgi:quercetin dioxygenase-like cupin family protein